jgi:hypothetical protein
MFGVPTVGQATSLGSILAAHRGGMTLVHFLIVSDDFAETAGGLQSTSIPITWQHELSGIATSHKLHVGLARDAVFLGEAVAEGSNIRIDYPETHGKNLCGINGRWRFIPPGGPADHGN